MARKLFAIALLAVAATVGGANTASAGGGFFPKVSFYPYYYPPYAYSTNGPFYSHVYPYYATYYYPHYAPYYPVYPTIYAGPGAGVQVFTPMQRHFAYPVPFGAAQY